MLIATRRGWPQRDESRDSRWAAFEVGAAIIAIRLIPDPPISPRPERPDPNACVACAEYSG
jgi:hypothetical protein